MTAATAKSGKGLSQRVKTAFTPTELTIIYPQRHFHDIFPGKDTKCNHCKGYRRGHNTDETHSELAGRTAIKPRPTSRWWSHVHDVVVVRHFGMIDGQ